MDPMRGPIDVRATRTIVRKDAFTDFTVVILQGTRGTCYGAAADGGLFVTWDAVAVSAPKRPAAETELHSIGDTEGILRDHPEEGVEPRDVEVDR
jgi:hypothetical protein